MANSLTATVNVDIDAPVPEVWDALTNPGKIKKYLHDTQAISEWKEGSSLEFRGEWKGKKYVDKGEIKKIQPNDLLQYSWLSSASGLEDKPENYTLVTYKLRAVSGKTKLTLSQDNIKNEEGLNNPKRTGPWYWVI